MATWPKQSYAVFNYSLTGIREQTPALRSIRPVQGTTLNAIYPLPLRPLPPGPPAILQPRLSYRAHPLTPHYVVIFYCKSLHPLDHGKQVENARNLS